MLDYGRNKMSFVSEVTGDIHEVDVTEYVVWWMTPMGVISDRETAIQRCVAVDLDPAVIQPVPVAIYIDHGSIKWYELCIRSM